MEKPNFAGLESLLDLGRRDGVDIRSTLLRVLTDQYVQNPVHSPDEERHYTELALRLIEETDYIVRTAVAERFASYPAAPHAVIERLARDIVQVAGPLLKYSPCLTPGDLAAIARDCGETHAAIIATRGKRDERQTSSLPATATEIAGRVNEDAAKLCDLFFVANGAERRLILMNLEYLPVVEAQVTPSDEAARLLETTALAHNIEAFARELERALRISSRQARRVVQDQLGEPIVVVAKALNMPPSMLQRILLFLNPLVGQSVQRVYDLALLYDEITAAAACHLVAIWRDSDPPAYQPSRLAISHRRAEENRAYVQERAAAQRDTLKIQRSERALGINRR